MHVSSDCSHIVAVNPISTQGQTEEKGGARKGAEYDQFYIGLSVTYITIQRSAKKWYVVARNFFLLLLNCSPWPLPAGA